MKSDIKSIAILGGTFFIFFLALTPLGLFNDWIPKTWHTGYYSVMQIDEGDDAGYYAYLRSAFFDGDLDFINEKKYAHIEHFTSTGYVFNNWQIGQSILFIPFFLLGHLSAIILNNLGYSFAIDGYSSPYFIATAIAAQTYVFIGLLLLYRILARYFSQTPALAATIGVCLGSPLIYYSFIRQRMAHGTEFFLSIVFIMVWLIYRNSRNKYHHALLGLVFGLLCSIRMINIMYLSLYIVDQAVQWFKCNERKNYLKQYLTEIIFFGLFSALALTPQLLVWNQLNGSLLSYINKSLAIMNAESSSSNVLALLGDKVFQLFFGPKWSLILMTPIFFLGTLGVFFIRNSAKELLPGILAFLFSNFLVAMTNPDSASYGNRYLIPSIGFFAFGIAGAMDRFKNNQSVFKGGIVLITLFIILHYLVLIQYRTSLSYFHPQFTLKALSEIPNLFLENSHLLSRSTNFFNILFSIKPETFTKESFLFLFLFPSAQLVCVVFACFLFNRFKSNFIEKNNFAKYAFSLLLLSNLICFSYLYKIMPTKSPEQIKKRHAYKVAIKEGDINARKGNIKEGLRLFTIASKNIPKHWGSYLRMGYAYDALLDYKMANNYYKKVLELNPYQIDSYRKLGINNFRLGHYQEVEFLLKKSVQLDPLNKESYHYLALLFSEQERTSEAIKMFEMALALDPNYISAHLNISILLFNSKQPQKAISHFNEASRLGADNDKILKLARQLGLTAIN